MILRTLRVERFGRFDEGEWEFAPGLTVIRGPNEAGKSTMREAIVRLLLPGKKIDTTDAGFLSLVTWRSDRRFVLSCEFECECGRFSLTRDFEQRRRQVDRGDVGARARHGLAQQATAAAHVEHARPGQRPPRGHVVQAHRIERMQRLLRALRVPPAIGELGELVQLGLSEVGAR